LPFCPGHVAHVAQSVPSWVARSEHQNWATKKQQKSLAHSARLFYKKRKKLAFSCVFLEPFVN